MNKNDVQQILNKHPTLLASNLSIVEIMFLEKYLNHVKSFKKSHTPDRKNTFTYNNISDNTAPDNDYYNQYELGSKQTCHQVLPVHYISNNMKNHNTRANNIDIESNLRNGEISKCIGKKNINNGFKIDNFHTTDFIPLEQQNHVWSETNSQGGVSTRRNRVKL